MNYNLLTSSDLNAAQITSEVTEQVVTKTNRWISFWNEHVPDLISFGVEIGFSLLIFFVGRFLIRWIRRIVRRSIERSSADTGVEQFIDSLLKFLLYTLLLFIIIQNLGVPSTSIAAVIASAGVAVSLALQESLSNLAGGIQILLLKPFVVGDYIREDNKGNEGYVYRNDYHTTNSYYPAWIKEDQITFHGSRLKDNTVNEPHENMPEHWVGYCYAWGYADNHPNGEEQCKFKIDWAVDKNGNPVVLDGIDFVRIYTAVNQNSGWMGEISTELQAVEDLHFKK